MAKEEAKGTGSERHVKLKSPTHPTPLTCRPVQEGVVLREVWAEQADLLVTQVCCAHPPPHILHTTHSCTFTLWLYVCMHKWNCLCPFPTRGSRVSIRLLGSYYMKLKHQHRYGDSICTIAIPVCYGLATELILVIPSRDTKTVINTTCRNLPLSTAPTTTPLIATHHHTSYSHPLAVVVCTASLRCTVTADIPVGA